MDGFGCDAGIITPAFPQMGRTVVNGHLRVHGDDTWNPVDVIALLRSQGVKECNHVTPGGIAQALAGGARYISLECSSNEDLRLIATEAIRCGRKILWAGSGGLASALAKVLFSEKIRSIECPPGNRAVLFCIGSQHPIVAAQLEILKTQRATCELDVRSAIAAEITAALAAARHTILRLDIRETGSQQIHELLSGVSEFAEAIVISGGDTLALFCRAMQCGSIEIEDQIVPGMPWGIVRGGLLDGVTVATRSGAFGEPGDLTKVADFFTCLKN
jgi:uncharacterized protein YgbK (DUF1537 family)